MQNIQTPQSSASTISQKKSAERSPTEDLTSPEQENKPKVIRMSEYADKKDIEMLKQLINTNTLSLNESIKCLSNNVLSLTQEISTIRKDIQEIDSRVKTLEESQGNSDNAMENVAAELNAINQIELESQLSILNVPVELDSKQAFECISKWANIQLSDGNIRRCAIAKPKGRNSAVLQLDFYDLSAKHKLMKHVRANQKDKDKKYIPILSEMIFNILPLNASNGLELHFRESFTELNRNIFNAARKHKKIFVNVWLNRGYIMVKQEDANSENGKSIRIKSMNELNELINKFKCVDSMEH